MSQVVLFAFSDTDDGVIVTRRKLRQRTAAKKRGGKEKPIKEEDKKEEPVRKGDRREEPVEIDSEEEVDRKQKRQSPKRILRKPKEDGKNKKQMKAAGNGRKRVKEPDTGQFTHTHTHTQLLDHHLLSCFVLCKYSRTLFDVKGVSETVQSENRQDNEA
jgi:hypothetical protein